MQTEMASWTFPEIKPITDVEFCRFQAFIKNEAGIFLSEVKRALLVGRLARRLRELGLTSFGRYYEYIRQRGDEEIRVLLNCVTTNETHFFREPAQFEYLRSVLIPSWVSASGSGPRHLRIWSAACSTGEEPYSIAMTVLDALQHLPDTSFDVFASDISTRVLDRAMAGIYPIQKADEIPLTFRKTYMLKGRGSNSDCMKVGPALTKKVTFNRVNLVGDLAEVPGSFDVIFCRNVLIYFQPETKTKVLCDLIAKLRPGGHLFLGHAETLHGVRSRTACPIPNVYIFSPA
jgi:chemotaxis protein methyltransferase CheR